MRLIHDRKVKPIHGLPVQTLTTRQSSLQRPPHPLLTHRRTHVLPVHERGIRREHHHRPTTRPQSQLDRVGSRVHPELLQDVVLLEGAHRDHGRAVADPAPDEGGLHEEVQGGDHHEDPTVPEVVQGGPGSGDRLAGPGRRHDSGTRTTLRHGHPCRESHPIPDTHIRIHLVFPKLNQRHSLNILSRTGAV